ncbi:MAG: beta-lactamase family protein [Sphingomonadales bacterium]|nr:beta-lactamase family protein [Sphingomonadales bacterium]
MIDDSALKAAIGAANIPGASVALIDRDGTTYSRAFGHADIAAETPMREDTVVQIASMTKAITSIAAMQLVEAGRLSLDAPIGDVLPELAAPEVLTGFADDGTPQSRPATRPITLRHLLTHTAGFGYPFIHPDILRWFAPKGLPPGNWKAGIRMPLMFDPGDRWEYSVATDWAGQVVEAVSGQNLQDYFIEHITGPLGMGATRFRASDEMPQGAAKVHVRTPEGSLSPVGMHIQGGDFFSGGGGLSSTAPDYARFVRMLLNGGTLDGVRIVSPATIADMTRNQVAPLRAGYMGSAMPEFAPPYDAIPDQHTGWGLGFLINPQAGPNGRSPGSQHWAGIFNSYYWFDPAKGVGGVFMSQLAPFGDSGALAAFGALERMAYA